MFDFILTQLEFRHKIKYNTNLGHVFINADWFKNWIKIIPNINGDVVLNENGNYCYSKGCSFLPLVSTYLEVETSRKNYLRFINSISADQHFFNFLQTYPTSCCSLIHFLNSLFDWKDTYNEISFSNYFNSAIEKTLMKKKLDKEEKGSRGVKYQVIKSMIIGLNAKDKLDKKDGNYIESIINVLNREIDRIISFIKDDIDVQVNNSLLLNVLTFSLIDIPSLYEKAQSSEIEINQKIFNNFVRIIRNSIEFISDNNIDKQNINYKNEFLINVRNSLLSNQVGLTKLSVIVYEKQFNEKESFILNIVTFLISFIVNDECNNLQFANRSIDALSIFIEGISKDISDDSLFIKIRNEIKIIEDNVITKDDHFKEKLHKIFSFLRTTFNIQDINNTRLLNSRLRLNTNFEIEALLDTGDSVYAKIKDISEDGICINFNQSEYLSVIKNAKNCNVSYYTIEGKKEKIVSFEFDKLKFVEYFDSVSFRGKLMNTVNDDLLKYLKDNFVEYYY